MFNKFGKDFVIYGLGIAFTKSLAIITLPILTLYLSSSGIGTLELMTSLSSLLVLFILLGVDTGVTFFFWDKKDSPKLQSAYVSNALYIIMLSSFFVCIILHIFKDIFLQYYFKVESLEYYHLLYFFVITQALFVFFTKLLRTKLLTMRYNIAILSSSISFIVFIYFFLKANPTEGGVLFGRITSNVIVLIFFIPFIFGLLKKKVDKIIIKDLLGYSLPIMPFAIVTILLGMSDTYFINIFLGTDILGKYTIVVKVAGIISLVIAAFSLVYGPLAMSIKDNANAKKIYANLYELYVFLCVFLVLLIQYFSIYLLEILVSNSENYKEYLYLVGIVSSYAFFANSFGQLGIGLNILKKNKYFSYFTALAFVINVILNILFVEMYGLAGIATASLISIIVACSCIAFISNRYYPIKYNFSFLFSCKFILIISVFSEVFYRYNISLELIAFLVIIGLYKLTTLSKEVRSYE